MFYWMRLIINKYSKKKLDLFEQFHKCWIEIGQSNKMSPPNEGGGNFKCQFLKIEV